MNSLSDDSLLEISEFLQQLAEDSTTRAVILRGAGKEAFSAGADIVAPEKKSGNTKQLANQPGAITTALLAIQKFPYPVIAMLYGYAIGGGCILSMASDIRVASNTVKMSVPTSKMGLIPTPEIFKRFMTVLGYSTALEMFITGRQYEGIECLRMGMVNHMRSHDELEEFTYTLASQIVTDCAPMSLTASKCIMNHINENPTLSADEMLHFRKLAIQARQSFDFKEAKLAFKEKRKPIFKGA
jgi:enoyl-CoA hydratase/carnithine racemase